MSPSTTAGGWERDVEYARVGGEPLTLDAYCPPAAEPHPAVIVVHGGGWSRGDKQTYVPPLFPSLEQAGLAIFTINYRLAPRHPYPAAVEDVEAALQYVRSEAKRLGVDPRRVAFLGESAGGHLAALAALRLPPTSAPRGVVALYATLDLPARVKQQGTLANSLRDFFGSQVLDSATVRRLEEASPVRLARPGMPPFFLVHGTADEVVPYEQSVLMHRRMTELGEACELMAIEGGRHGLDHWESERRPAYKERIAEWLVHRLAE